MALIKSLYRWLLPYQTRNRLHLLRYTTKYQRIRHHSKDHPFNLFDKHKCLFIHIPKTGGVSVCSSLWSSKKDEMVIKSMGHFTARDYEIIFGKATCKSYFKFTFVRNPWSRVLSSYQFLKQGGFNSRDRAWAEKHLSRFSSFNEFVVEWINHRNIYRALHFIPQYEFLKSVNEEVKMDFIGRLENIDSDFDEIKNKLGISCQLRHYNKSNLIRPVTNYRELYTQETRDIIANVYRKDIDIFNYRF
ncbi:MAG: sulfotransferase family 2 domain-containing protein [Cyanobacteria bacterium P01_A01_bin.116]